MILPSRISDPTGAACSSISALWLPEEFLSEMGSCSEAFAESAPVDALAVGLGAAGAA